METPKEKHKISLRRFTSVYIIAGNVDLLQNLMHRPEYMVLAHYLSSGILVKTPESFMWSLGF